MSFFSDYHKLKINSSYASICYDSFVCTLARANDALLWYVLSKLAFIHHRKIKYFVFPFSQHAFFQNAFFSLLHVGQQYTNICTVHGEKILKLNCQIPAIPRKSRSEFGVIFLVRLSLWAFPEQGISLQADFTMDYNYLGRSGLRVSNICLGTMTFGKERVRIWILQTF